jgi:hypothetical protein
MAVTGCTSDTTSGESTGSLSLNLEVGSIDIDEVDFLITGDGMDPLGGTIDTSAPGATASVEVFGLVPGDYTVTLSATATNGETMCEGSEDFSVEVDELTEVMVYLRCKLPETLGGVRVNGEFNVCAVVTESVVKPLQTSVGNDIDLSAMGEDAEGDDITYLWTGTGGDIDDPSAKATTYTCEEVGKHSVTITVSDDGFDYCMDSWTTAVTCVEGDGPECTDDEDCGLDEICVDFECVPDLECTDDKDCDEGEVCNDNNECVPDVECNENDDCDLGDICLDNVCRADPDLFCDTGLCVEDTVLRAECVDKFLLCLAENVDEEECVVLSIALCTECTEAADCPDDGKECTDAVCDAGTCGTSNNTNVCDGGAGTCSAGVCVPDAECAVDGDCPPTGNECIDAVCDAGTCGTSNNTNACDGGAGTCSAGVCVPNAQVFYEENFESLDQASGTALGTAPGGAGFLVFGNEFLPDGTPIQGYGPFSAPNGTPGFCSIALEQGGPEQGAQVLVIYSDYNNGANQEAGNLVEANTFQEPFSNPDTLITAADLGTYTFCDPTAPEYTPNPPCDSTAVAFIKTLDPSAGFATTNNITVNTTAIPDSWNRYSIQIVVDNALIGQVLQFGFAATATNFEPSGVFYDNLLVTVE